MAEAFVIVHRSYDPILIEHLGEMLREAGIAARVMGTRDAALIGVGPSITELNLSVPRPQAAEATDFIEAFFQDEGEALLEREGLLDDDDDDEQEDDDDERPTKLSPALAGVSVLFCGLGHVYAKRRLTGLILAVAFILSFTGVLAAALKSVLPLGFSAFDGISFALLALVLADLIGGQFAVRAYNRGVRAGYVRQILHGVVYVAVAAAASTAPSLGKPLTDDLRVLSVAELERALERERLQRERLYFDPTIIDLNPNDFVPLVPPSR